MGTRKQLEREQHLDWLAQVHQQLQEHDDGAPAYVRDKISQPTEENA